MPTDTTASDPAAVPPLERPRAESEWADFVDAYGRAILAWFAQTGLSPEDTHKTVRTLLAFLHKEFADVLQEPARRFRAWLQYALHISWCRTMEVLVEQHGEDSRTPLITLLLSIEAHDSLLHALDVECSRLRRRELLVRVQELAAPSDWEVFYAVVLEDRPLGEVAAERACPEFAVRGAAHRVHRVLHQDYQSLEENF